MLGYPKVNRGGLVATTFLAYRIRDGTINSAPIL